VGDRPDDFIVLDLHGDERAEGFVLPLAGCRLWSDAALRASAVPAPRPARRRVADDAWQLVYDGPGIVAGGEQRIRAWRGAGGSRRVELADGESFDVAATGDAVRRVVAAAGEPLRAYTVERALGAPLVLALALRGAHVLHASALGGPRGVVALVGDTGAGKSTLAAAAVRPPDLGLRRVADDQLAVELATATALPCFPQLKLGAATSGWPEEEPRRLPLVAVVELARDRPGAKAEPTVDAVALEPLDRAEASLAIARATVAARLLDEELLTAHLDGCVLAAQRLSVLRLRYASGERPLSAALGLLRSIVGCV
jgi:hypothetical protein